jgi:carbamate kinase
MRIVVAFGGNAILQAGQRGTAEEQRANVDLACKEVAEMIAQGNDVVITHGNGPQVGNILIQNDAGSAQVPAMPMDICGAESQGLIGYMIQQSLGRLLAARGITHPVTTLVTQVVVDKSDPAFEKPSKPVGPFYPAEAAKQLTETKGFVMKEDKARGGWRRVVPSPDPKRIVEAPCITELLQGDTVVIASGGGGIPVVENNGYYEGVEAVIDKDLAGERLAEAVHADVLVILTDVAYAAVNFKQPGEKRLETVKYSEMRGYQGEGHFAAGSMGPKVEAALRFIAAGGKKSIITSLKNATAALAGKAGTIILPD